MEHAITLFDLLMAIGLMVAAGALLVRLDKNMSDRELIAHMNKMHRKQARLRREVAK